MIKYFNSFNVIDEISKPENPCWINVINPTSEEIDSLIKDYKIQNSIN